MQNLRNTQQQLVAAGWIEQIQLLEKGIFNVSIRQNNQIHNWRVDDKDHFLENLPLQSIVQLNGALLHK